MKWDTVQQKGRDKGYLVFAMNPGQTPVMTPPGPAGNARTVSRAGCVVWWIALRYDSSDLPYNPKTHEGHMAWRATPEQAIYEEVDSHFPDLLVPVFSKCRLGLNKGSIKRYQCPVSGSMLRRAVSHPNDCYYIVLQGSDGGHAVAMQNMGDKKGWRFFDADEGEFVIDDREALEPFIAWYIAQTAYRFRYGNATRIVQVYPPPPDSLPSFASVLPQLSKLFGL